MAQLWVCVHIFYSCMLQKKRNVLCVFCSQMFLKSELCTLRARSLTQNGHVGKNNDTFWNLLKAIFGECGYYIL